MFEFLFYINLKHDLAKKINKLFYFANLFCQQLSSSDEIAYENKLKIQQKLVYMRIKLIFLYITKNSN